MAAADTALRFARRTPVADAAAGTATAADRSLPFGVDLGTTNVVVAMVHEGAAKVLQSSTDRGLLPSTVQVHPDGGLTTSPTRPEDAPDSTLIAQTKRIMGLATAHPTAAACAGRWSADVVGDAHGVACVRVGATTLSPTSVATMLMRHAAAAVARVPGCTLTQAVVTVPSYFSAAQCAATQDACAAAGVQVLQLLEEPEAAMLAATAKGTSLHTLAPSEGVLVVDVGGGTTDVAVGEPCVGGMAVRATAGNPALGGMDVDLAILRNGCDDTTPGAAARAEATLASPAATQAALRRVRDAKEACVRMGRMTHAVVEGWRVPIRVTTELLRCMTQSVLQDRVLDVIRAAQDRAPDVAIAHVVHAGGCAHLPGMADVLRGAFPKARHHTPDRPDTLVARGAALHAARKRGLLQEAVVIHPGAALAVTVSLPLGVQTASGTVHPIVPHGWPVEKPCPVRGFTTRTSAQRSLALRIVRGFAPVAKACDKVGTAVLSIPNSIAAGVPSVDIIATPHADGSLTVRAREDTTNVVLGGTTLPDAVVCGLDVAAVREEQERGRQAALEYAATLAVETEAAALESCIARCRRLLLDPQALPAGEGLMHERQSLEAKADVAEKVLLSYRVHGDAEVDGLRAAAAQLAAHASHLARHVIIPRQGERGVSAAVQAVLVPPAPHLSAPE
jgi:molecular chaperone HscA